MIGQAIGGSLPLAVGIAISPVPIIAVVLILTSQRAKVNGPAFVLGWLAGPGIVGAIVLTLAGAVDLALGRQTLCAWQERRCPAW
jgi:hypothetical protein